MMHNHNRRRRRSGCIRRRLFVCLPITQHASSSSIFYTRTKALSFHDDPDDNRENIRLRGLDFLRCSGMGTPAGSNPLSWMASRQTGSWNHSPGASRSHLDQYFSNSARIRRFSGQYVGCLAVTKTMKSLSVMRCNMGHLPSPLAVVNLSSCCMR